MPPSCELLIYDQGKVLFTRRLTSPLELGRCEAHEEFLVEGANGRFPLARREETTVPRHFLRISPRPDGQICIENLTKDRRLRLGDGSEVPFQSSRNVTPPVLISIGGSRAVRIQPEEGAAHLHSLPQATMAPGGSSLVVSPLQEFRGEGGDVGRSIIGLLQAAMGVFQSAATSSDFFPKAAQAVVEIAGLDSGSVLLWKDGDWRSQACYAPPSAACSPKADFSRRVLNRLREEKRTFWEDFDVISRNASLADAQAVVASPILDRRGEVIGAIYGDRRGTDPNRRMTVTDIEAMLVELVACAVAAGLARIEQEEAALRAQVQFEQFFTGELARQLTADPNLLEGRDCEVTVLFCDIRRFSRISEHLGPAKTFEWVRDVMNELSGCILAHQGVLVDYVGDEVMAMWGAPKAQPNHAELACRAGMEILARLAPLNARWSGALGQAMDLGIGINSGPAKVGNTGSQHKFKYGPLGNTVNLGSRVQGATKYLRARLLITGSTRARLGESLAARRLCCVRVVNIAEPVELYELAPADQPGWHDLKRAYESAYGQYEQGDFRNAARIAADILAAHPDDGPAIVLLSRASQSLAEPAEVFDPVWELAGK